MFAFPDMQGSKFILQPDIFTEFLLLFFSFFTGFSSLCVYVCGGFSKHAIIFYNS